MKFEDDGFRQFIFDDDIQEDVEQTPSPVKASTNTGLRNSSMNENDEMSDSEQRDLRVIDILEQSETYMQRNLNAVCNNMSLLTLHTFEFGNQIEMQRNDQLVKDKIVKNMEDHATFMKSKSEQLRNRLQKATARFGKPDIQKLNVQGISDPTRELLRRQSIQPRN